MSTPRCPGCQSQKLIADASLSTSEEQVQVEVSSEAGPGSFKGWVRSAVQARVCGNRGLISLYASDPERLAMGQPLDDQEE